MLFSVVIPTYNRKEKVIRAINSTLKCFDSSLDFEIIIVDDESKDKTIEEIERLYLNEIQKLKIRLVQNKINQGCTGSKNIGYNNAKGKWVIFLDSDDEFIYNAGNDIVESLLKHKDRSIIFFRCINHNNEFVGKQFNKDCILDLKTYIRKTSFGEALTSINKIMVLQEPYLKEFPHSEGIGCIRIINKYGNAILSSVIARKYFQIGEDRSSSIKKFLKYLPTLSKAHLIIINEFRHKMNLATLLERYIKAYLYRIVGYFANKYIK